MEIKTLLVTLLVVVVMSISLTNGASLSDRGKITQKAMPRKGEGPSNQELVASASEAKEEKSGSGVSKQSGQGLKSYEYQDGHQAGYEKGVGHQSSKGYQDDKSYKKSTKGDYAYGDDKAFHDRGTKKYGDNNHNSHDYGKYDHGYDGSKGHGHGSKGHVSKGHKDSGFKNLYHKDEYSKSTTFNDDSDRKSNQKGYDHFDDFSKGHERGFVDGGSYGGSKDHDQQGKRGSFDHGRAFDIHGGHESSYGARDHHAQDSDYAHSGHYNDYRGRRNHLGHDGKGGLDEDGGHYVTYGHVDPYHYDDYNEVWTGYDPYWYWLDFLDWLGQEEYYYPSYGGKDPYDGYWYEDYPSYGYGEEYSEYNHGADSGHDHDQAHQEMHKQSPTYLEEHEYGRGDSTDKSNTGHGYIHGHGPGHDSTEKSITSHGHGQSASTVKKNIWPGHGRDASTVKSNTGHEHGRDASTVKSNTGHGHGRDASTVKSNTGHGHGRDASTVKSNTGHGHGRDASTVKSHTGHRHNRGHKRFTLNKS